MELQLFILAGALAVIASVFIPAVVTGSSPVATSGRVRKALLGLLPKRLPRGPEASIIYELGSGWGGMAFALAKSYPNYAVIGYEISPLPWLVAQLRLGFSNQPNLQFRFASYYNHNLSDATLLLCYLLPEPMEKLRLKLARELTPGTLILSNTFAFRGWRPLDQRVAEDIYKSHVYLYEIGTTSK